MKNIILGLALVAAAACTTPEKTNATSDASTPNAECATKSGCCAEKAAANCEGKKECSGEAKVCPATGKTMN